MTLCSESLHVLADSIPLVSGVLCETVQETVSCESRDGLAETYQYVESHPAVKSTYWWFADSKGNHTDLHLSMKAFKGLEVNLQASHSLKFDEVGL